MTRLPASIGRLAKSTHVRKHVSQLWKFAIAGGIGSVIDLGSLTLFVEYFGINPWLAFPLSTIPAVLAVFIINKFFTFKNRERSYKSQLLKFSLVYGVAIVLNLLTSYALFWLGMRLFGDGLREVYVALLARAGAIAIGAAWNYTLSNGFVFKKGEDVDAVVV